MANSEIFMGGIIPYNFTQMLDRETFDKFNRQISEIIYDVIENNKFSKDPTNVCKGKSISIAEILKSYGLYVQMTPEIYKLLEAALHTNLYAPTMAAKDACPICCMCAMCVICGASASTGLLALVGITSLFNSVSAASYVTVK